MSRKILLGLAFAAASSLAASPRGTVPKAGANHYAAHAEKAGVSVGATMLTSDEARKVFVSEVNRCCVVVEVALYPQKGKPQPVSLDDFAVRVVSELGRRQLVNLRWQLLRFACFLYSATRVPFSSVEQARNRNLQAGTLAEREVTYGDS